MARPRKLSNDDVLVAALGIVHGQGPDHLTFATASEACGLSPATLVQRFGTRDGLLRAALLRAWDNLYARTAELARSAPPTPQGAIDLLVSLSGSYGGIEAYAEGLKVLREDFRDPELRARGAAWKRQLIEIIERCFVMVPIAPNGIGLLLISQWQGSLLWWAFEPERRVDEHVAEHLGRFVKSVC